MLKFHPRKNGKSPNLSNGTSLLKRLLTTDSEDADEPQDDSEGSDDSESAPIGPSKKAKAKMMSKETPSMKLKNLSRIKGKVPLFRKQM